MKSNSTACARVAWFLALAAVHATTASAQGNQGAEVCLASGGVVRCAVVVASNATPAVRNAATDLAAYLGKMTGASFAIETGDGAAGLAVGVRGDFPAIAWPAGIVSPEGYFLRSHPRGVHLVGATEAAVAYAVWDFLYRLGYRQFFPGPTWEIVPKRAELRVAVDVATQPAYVGRSIWFGWGCWPANWQRYTVWRTRNRMQSSYPLSSGHAYEAIIATFKADFEAHPEYLGLVSGKRTSTKFCIGNPKVRKLVACYALRLFEAHPDAPSVSVEPSDGCGWCECEACAALGSITDRQVFLANEVAAAVQEKFPGKVIGFYAYNLHSPPPTIDVASNVIVSIATAYVKGGYTVDQLFEGWGRAKAHLGVREYYSVNIGDRDMPGLTRGGNIGYLRTTIPKFYRFGARFMSAESSDNWGPNGLGYYLASRMLWDTNEAGRVEALTEDFLTQCFGPAREPMREFYRLIDGANKPMLSEDLLGRMFRALKQARELAADPAILARLNDLVLYVRYVALFRAYTEAPREGQWRPKPIDPLNPEDEAPKPARQQAFEAVVRHAYRMRDSQMIHSFGFLRDQRDGYVWLPPEARFQAAERVDNRDSEDVTDFLEGKTTRDNYWKKAEPFAEKELNTIVERGVASHRLLDFTPVSFSSDLVPSTPLHLPAISNVAETIFFRGQSGVWFWSTNAPFEVPLKVTAGLIYNFFGNAVFRMLPAGETTGAAVDRAEVAPDRQERAISLKSSYTGLHRIEWSDRAAGTQIRLPDGLAFTWPCTPEDPVGVALKQDLYFYVPKGTRTIGGAGNAAVQIVAPDGTVARELRGQASWEYFSVPVPPGTDGQAWRLKRRRGGTMTLMTVPPWLAFSPADLLLPKEVVESDAPFAAL